MGVKASPSAKNLVWKHFKKVGSAPDGSGHDAHTAPKYGLDIPNRVGIVKEGGAYKVAKLDVKVNLNTANTWVIKGHETSGLLEHERRHWMMDIVVGYELEQAVLALSNPNPKRLKEKIQSEFNWHRNKREKWLADKYDHETTHGTDAKAQAEWQTKIDKWFKDKKIPLKTLH